jgi:hypothetical protein
MLLKHSVDIGCKWVIINKSSFYHPALKGRVDCAIPARERPPRLEADSGENSRRPPRSGNVDYVIIAIRSNKGGTTGVSSRPLRASTVPQEMRALLFA